MLRKSSLMLLLAVSMSDCLGCGIFVQPGDKCTDPGELVCGGPSESVQNAVTVFHCVGSAYSRAGNCPQSCDHVTNVRTSVGCGDKTIRAVPDARCDSNGGACSMDQKQVMNCTNAVWTPITTCIGNCILKPSGALGCE